MDNEIKSLPMVALRGMTIMPEMVVHFDVSRERSIAAVQEAMVEEQKIFLTAQKSIDTEDPGAEDVYEIGTVGTIKQIIKLPKHIVRVLVSGEVRGRLKEIEYKDPYLRAQVEIINDADLTIPEDLNGEAMERGLKDMLVEYAAKNGKMSKESVAQLLDIKGIKKLVDEIAANIPLYYTDMIGGVSGKVGTAFDEHSSLLHPGQPGALMMVLSPAVAGIVVAWAYRGFAWTPWWLLICWLLCYCVRFPHAIGSFPIVHLHGIGGSGI